MPSFRAASSVLIAAALLGGCQHRQDDLEPSITVKEVRVQVPVPCPALALLGPEPVYPDTAEALAGATIGQAAALYAQGRVMRMQRLVEYTAARAACVF